MNKKLFYRIPIVIFMVFWLIVDTIQPWTKWPEIHLTISSKQASLSESVSIDKYLGNWSIFFYFTLITNIIVVAVVVASWIFKFKFTKQWKLMVVVYSIITFVVFWTSLAPFMPWGQNWYFDFIYIYEHGIVFLLFAFWFWESDTKVKETKFKYLKLFIVPGIYLLAQIIFYVVIDGKVATYPFLNFKNYFDLNLNEGLSIFLGAITTIAILGIGALIYWLLEKTDHYFQVKLNKVKK